MTARQQAIRDIKDDLRQENRCFIAFRHELDPMMDHLVRSASKVQALFSRRAKSNAQLVARCFYSRMAGSVKYENYSKYYNR